MEQFITGDIWALVNKKFKPKQRKSACIAYVTSNMLNLGNGDTLICDASEYSIKYGSTSARTLAFYLSKGVRIYSNANLHSKFLISETFLVIGSANLSRSSAENLIESAIITDNSILLAQAKAFYFNLLEESTIITKNIIKQLLSIEVIKRPHKPKGHSKTRQKKFGDRYWFVSVSPLKEKTYEKIKDQVESTSKIIAERKDLNIEDVGFIRWRKNTFFTENAKEGDQVIIKWTNENKTRSYVYPPSTILKKQIKNGFTDFYHDASGDEYDPITWINFQKLTMLVLGKSITVRTRNISSEEVNNIMTAWS